MSATRSATRQASGPHKHCIVRRFESDMLQQFPGVSKNAESRFFVVLTRLSAFHICNDRSIKRTNIAYLGNLCNTICNTNGRPSDTKPICPHAKKAPTEVRAQKKKGVMKKIKKGQLILNRWPTYMVYGAESPLIRAISIQLTFILLAIPETVSPG